MNEPANQHIGASAGGTLGGFFKAGGTLPPDIPSYVLRPADGELLELTLAGEFCYVLTPRQMGKSSLMLRAARSLAERDVKTAIVDLTEIGVKVTIEQWYLGILDGIVQAVTPAADLPTYWRAHTYLGFPQRFIGFLREILLAATPEPIVIFLDEIDSTLSLDFRDDFFAAIRACYNARAATPELRRLTFVFLGVASPADLIKDSTRTPFNVGYGVALHEFSRADAAMLEPGLETKYPGQGAALLDRIFYWTAGHPYLTQKLCAEAVRRGDVGAAARVDILVEELFLATEARNESNLKFVQERVLATDVYHDARLRLYRDVWCSRPISDAVQSPVHDQLKLYGLVKVENGVLCVHNEIYRHVFDRAWVRAHLPMNWARVVAAVAVVVAVLAIGLIAYGAWVDSQARSAYYDFNKTDEPQERLGSMTRIFRQRNPLNSRGYARDAHELFFGLPRAEQLALFDPEMPEANLVEVITGLYTTLADVDETGATTPLLAAMRDALPPESASQTTRELRAELSAWLTARELVASGQVTAALESYIVATNLDYENSAIWYEKARVRLELGQTTEALDDLEQVLAQVNKSNEPTPTPEPTETPSPTPTATSTRPPIVTAMPTPTSKTGTPSPAATTTLETFLPTTSTVIPSPSLPLTPSSTATLDSAPIPSQFRDLGQIRRAIKVLIHRYPAAALALNNAGTETYPYLREAGLALRLTPTVMPMGTMTPTSAITPTPTNVIPPTPGHTLFYDDFRSLEQVQQWTTGSGGTVGLYKSGAGDATNGALQIIVDGWPDRVHSWKSLAPMIECITCSIQVTGWIPEGGNAWGYGIVFGFEDVDNYYLFEIRSDDIASQVTYGFTKGDSQDAPFYPYYHKVTPTSNFSHTLRVDIYINNAMPDSVFVAGYIDSGLVNTRTLPSSLAVKPWRAGLVAAAKVGSDGMVLFDNFRVSELPDNFYPIEEK